MGTGEFQAGVGRVDITPPLTAPHASWGAQVHVLPDGVDEPLWVSALVLSDGDNLVVWVDFDIVILTNDDTSGIQACVGEALDISPDQVRVSVTHNHAGPPPNRWNWTKQGQEALEGYYAALPEYAAGAARAAANDMWPARVGADSGKCFVAFNRREMSPDGRIVTGYNPGGFMDPEVFVTRIDSLDGIPIAAIVGYTMHPTTMGPSNRLISPDWPGYLKRTVELATDAMCLFAQGACGNIGPGPNGFTDDVGVIVKLGAQVGLEASGVYHGIDVPPVEYFHDRVQESGAPLSLWNAVEQESPAPAIRFVTRKVAMPLLEQPPLEMAEERMEQAQQQLDDLKASGAADSEVEAATFVTKRANMTLSRVRSYGGKTEAELDIHVLRIGDIVLASVVGEPFAEIGQQIKDRSPFAHTWFGGYVGGWAGYIPTAAAYPEKGYEVETSPFAPEAEQVLVDSVVALLEEMHSS